MILSFLLVAAQVVLVGDSTLQVRPDEAPQGSWGMMAAERLKPGVGVCNLAVGGRSTRTYRDVWETNVLKTVKAGDWVVIQFGHNDGWKDSDPKAPRRETDPQTEYKDNLRRFVSEIRALDAKPVLVTSISLYLWKKDGTWPEKDPLEPWVQAMREVAAETRTLLVDLHAPTLREVRALGREASMMWFMYSVNGRDWAHPTKYGARMIARLFWEELRRTGGPFAECFDLSSLCVPGFSDSVSQAGSQATPYTHLNYLEDANEFRFAIIPDRYGADYRAKDYHSDYRGGFTNAIRVVNLLRPNFVMSVGDLIPYGWEGATSSGRAEAAQGRDRRRGDSRAAARWKDVRWS